MIYRRQKSSHWLIEFTINGERYRRSSGTTNKAKAEAVERKFRQEAEELVLLGKPREMTLGQALDRYRDTVLLTKGKKRAVQSDCYALGTIKKRLGPTTPLLRLKASAIADFRDSLIADGKAPATANRYLALLKATLRRANSEWGALPVVPPIKLFKLNNARYRWLTEDEEQRLLGVVAPHLRDLIVFLIDTGARRSEATKLTWRNVHLDPTGRGSVSFMDTKSGKPRSIPLTNRVRTMLEAWKADAPRLDDRVFLYRPLGRGNGKCQNPGKPRPFGFPYAPWNTALKRCGLEDVRLHDLRHTFASRLVMRKVPLATVSHLLGHASIQMTMRYSHLSTDAFDDAIAVLDNVG